MREVRSGVLLSAAVAGLLSGACGSDPDPKPRGDVTSSKVVADMTLEKFTAECDARGGQVETHSHCGGANSCKGMSYDTATELLTEHTCRGSNTCAGYSCVIPDATDA